MFHIGELAQLDLGAGGSIDVTIVERVKDDKAYLYQVRDSNGKLWQEGRWVNQKHLFIEDTVIEPEAANEPSIATYDKVSVLLLSWHEDVDGPETGIEVIR